MIRPSSPTFLDNHAAQLRATCDLHPVDNNLLAQAIIRPNCPNFDAVDRLQEVLRIRASETMHCSRLRLLSEKMRATREDVITQMNDFALSAPTEDERPQEMQTLKPGGHCEVGMDPIVASWHRNNIVHAISQQNALTELQRTLVDFRPACTRFEQCVRLAALALREQPIDSGFTVHLRQATVPASWTTCMEQLELWEQTEEVGHTHRRNVLRHWDHSILKVDEKAKTPFDDDYEAMHRIRCYYKAGVLLAEAFANQRSASLDSLFMRFTYAVSPYEKIHARACFISHLKAAMKLGCFVPAQRQRVLEWCNDMDPLGTVTLPLDSKE